MSLLNTTLDKTNHFKTEKTKFYNWVSKWACNSTPTDETNADVTQICGVLQAMGFAIQFFDMPVNLNQTDDQQEKLSINIICKKSGLHASLSRPHTECSCPNADKVNEGKSLVPSMPDATAQVVKEVIFKLFSMLSDTKDINQNNNNEGAAAAAEAKDSKGTLTRQTTWEVDPKTSPPLSTSSPVPEANSEREIAVADLLQEARDAIDKALCLLPSKNNTFTKSKYVKRVSNIRVSPTIVTPTRSTTGVSTPDVPLKKTPIKSVTLLQQTPKKISGNSERRQLLVPSKVKFLSKRGTLTPTNDSLKINKRDTPWPASKSSSAFPSPKQTKTSSLRGSNSNLSAAGVNTNSSKPKSAIPSFGFKKTTPSSFKKA